MRTIYTSPFRYFTYIIIMIETAQYYYKPSVVPFNNMLVHRNMDIIHQDHSLQVFHFFDLYRTPFAVLCAASLYGFFQVTSKHRTDEKKGFEKFATRQLHISFVTPFMLSLVVLLISTMTITSILRGDFDSKAESAYEVIMREFKFQYTAIQWCCIISIISLIRGAYIHVVLDHNLFHGKKEEFTMVVADLFSFVTGALAYINSSLHSWGSFYGMTSDLFKVSDDVAYWCYMVERYEVHRLFHFSNNYIFIIWKTSSSVFR